MKFIVTYFLICLTFYVGTILVMEWFTTEPANTNPHCNPYPQCEPGYNVTEDYSTIDRLN